MQRNILGIIVAAVILFSIPSAFGLPFTTATESTVESNPINESSGDWNLDWSYVYNYKGCSSVAVSSYWTLTAAHVADDSGTGNLVINGVTYYQQEIRYYDGTAQGSTNVNDATCDLALVRYDKVLPGHYDIATGTSYNHQDVMFVGYGRAGTVTQSIISGSWTEITGDNAKRWGTNNIDGLTSITDAFGNTYNAIKTSLSSTMDSRNTAYETGLNIGDSGGGLFVYENNEWILVGINAYRAGTTSPYTTTYSIPVGNYDTWIINVIPEPATITLLVLGGAALLRRRKF